MYNPRGNSSVVASASNESIFIGCFMEFRYHKQFWEHRVDDDDDVYVDVLASRSE